MHEKASLSQGTSKNSYYQDGKFKEDRPGSGKQEYSH